MLDDKSLGKLEKKMREDDVAKTRTKLADAAKNQKLSDAAKNQSTQA